MEYKEFKPVIIATIVMIAMLGALCIATPTMAFEQYEPAVDETPTVYETPTVEETPSPLEVFSGGCEGLDQLVLRRYDFDNNGLIGSDEMEKAKIGYESNYETQDDYEQILYAYEHQCSVGSAVSPTPTPTPTYHEGGGGSSCVEVRGTIAEFGDNFGINPPSTIAASGAEPLYNPDVYADGRNIPGFQWDYSSFAGFWYDLDDDLQTEHLTILATPPTPGHPLAYPGRREIAEGGLIYTTHPVFQEYELHANEADPDRTTQTAMEAAYDDLLDQPIGLCVESDNAGGDCGYFIEGWMGEKYVAIDDNADKLCKLLVEFEDDDMKTLTVGEEWYMGGGYSLTAKQLDLEGNKVWFVLKKDGREIDNEVASTGDIDRPQERVYTYTADLAQEYDIPVFSCYVNTIFRGDDSWVEIMYVFLIDEDVLEIETSDTYGSMEVSTASSTWIVLDNDETTIDLGIDNTEHIMGNIYFKTADDDINDHIRFYPIVKYAISADDSDHDTDSDGVPDVWDMDNSTPAGYWVNSDGIGRMWGDMNGDGRLTSVDALMILQAAANGIKL